MSAEGPDVEAVVVALTTIDSEAAARALAHGLVDEHLAACVNIVPGVSSIYRWQGAIEEASEWLLVIKTARRCLERTRVRLLELHPYDTPEWVVVDVGEVSEGYGRWLLGEVRPAGSDPLA
jgi:periplasmic divalent cation tolerance protein